MPGSVCLRTCSTAAHRKSSRSSRTVPATESHGLCGSRSSSTTAGTGARRASSARGPGLCKRSWPSGPRAVLTWTATWRPRKRSCGTQPCSIWRRIWPTTMRLEQPRATELRPRGASTHCGSGPTAHVQASAQALLAVNSRGNPRGYPTAPPVARSRPCAKAPALRRHPLVAPPSTASTPMASRSLALPFASGAFPSPCRTTAAP
mmetsp:Transcript_33337/g.91970  ORF Transcript_33337/g.91970 Transcript_33337/m.91970 type:complete len:205 (-) Transcript_33337:280-894(-)